MTSSHLIHYFVCPPLPLPSSTITNTAIKCIATVSKGVVKIRQSFADQCNFKQFLVLFLHALGVTEGRPVGAVRCAVLMFVTLFIQMYMRAACLHMAGK